MNKLNKQTRGHKKPWIIPKKAQKIGCVLPVLINVAKYIRKYVHKKFEKDTTKNECKISVRGLNYCQIQTFGQSTSFLKFTSPSTPTLSWKTHI